MPSKTIAVTAYALLFVATITLVGACSPTLATRGNFVDDDRLKTVQLGVSTKAEVEQKLGTPTTTDPFDPDTWFYIGEKTSTTAFFDPEVEERKIYVMKFNKEGFLQTADKVDESAGKAIETVNKKTPAPGREVNAFEQFLGNLGKFNSSGMNQTQQGR